MSNIQPIWTSQVPAGCEVVNSGKGDRDTSISHAFISSNSMPAFPTGIEYDEPRPRCAWNDYQCTAHIIQNLPLCYGHLKKFLGGNIGELQGEEIQRLLQFKDQFEEFERNRVADKKKKQQDREAEIDRQIAEQRNEEVLVDGS